MRVLQVGLGNIGGGLEAFVMNYYRELSKMDVQFDFVCMYGKIAYEKEIKTESWWNVLKERTFITGYPRYDRLYNVKTEKKNIFFFKILL